MATMLELIQNVCNELGLDEPNAVATSTDRTYIQMLALMNRVGYQLEKDGYNWQNLKDINRITTFATTLTSNITDGSTTVTVADTSTLSAGLAVSGTGIQEDTHIASITNSTTLELDWAANATNATASLVYAQDKYSLPSGYSNILGNTTWDKTQQWAMSGSKTSQEWQYLTSGLISSTPIKKWRIFNGNFEVFPAPGNDERISFEYQSRNWALATDGVTTKSKFTADTDTSRIPEELLVMGTKLRFFEIKGFDTSALAAEFALAVDIEKGQDEGVTTLSMTPLRSTILLNEKNVPDSGYGS